VLDKFKNHVSNTFAFLGESRLLIACSGGVDSMVLAHLAGECKFEFALAHCNYKLRGQDSDLDQELVSSWGQERKIEVHSKTFDLSDETNSIQLKARQYRYDWFLSLLSTENFDFILTAHHADDSMETFFINLSRGTGLEGLTGIPQKNEHIVRPLLPFSKKEILGFAQSEAIPWREDESNTELKYVRNRIRHEIVPRFLEINPSFFSNFTRTQEHLGHSAQLLEKYAVELRTRWFVEDEDAFYVPISELKSLKPLKGYLHLLFSDFGFTQWNDMVDLLTAQSGKAIQSKTHRLIKDRENLILAPLPVLDEEAHTIQENEHNWQGPVELRFDKANLLENSSAKAVYVDKETLNYPLKLRKWKIGDYFYPLGMNGRKKVSKFFKDEKYSTVEKENQWLLCSQSDIVWVLGQRLDERFKVTEKTKEILKITWVS